MLAAHARKKRKSCLGRLLKFLLTLCFLVVLLFYVSNADFRENINCGVTGLVSNVSGYVTSLQEPDSPGFTLSGLWNALTREVPGFSVQELWSIITDTAESTLSSATNPKSGAGSANSSVTQTQGTTKEGSTLFSGSLGIASTCNTREEMVAAIAQKAADRPGSIKIAISSALYTLCDSSAWVTEVLYDAGIDWASYTRSKSFGSCSITFSKLEYLDAVPCSSLYQFKTLLAGAKTNGSISIRPTPALYTQLKENDWALLYASEGECGIVSHSFSSYNEPKRVLLFSDLVFADNFYSVSSVAEIKEQFFSSVQAGTETIAFHCSDQLFQKLIATTDRSGASVMGAIADNCGIMDANLMYYEERKLYYSQNLEYYPGARIICLYRNNRLNELTAQERILYNKAVEIASRAKRVSADEYSLILNICQEISAMADYRLCSTPNCEGCILDNAYGVMLNGGGECDSFTDAFYLIASLAGLDAGYQHGDVTELYNSSASDSGHIWNTVTLAGKTYFVDMTGTNTSSKTGGITPRWMLMGNDTARFTHIWDSETALRTLSPTVDESHSYYHRENRVFTTPAAAAACIKQHKNSAYGSIDILLINQSASTNEQYVQQLLGGLNMGGMYSHSSIGNRIYFTYFYK